jgi:drug/metabolite transporter (DMT)-like permease
LENPLKREIDSVRLGTGSGLLAIVLWSGLFAVARSVSEQVGSLTAGAAAYLVGSVFCVARLWCSKAPLARLRRLSRRSVLGCGFLFVLYTAVIYLAVGLARSREQLLEIALVNYLWPAATVLFSLPLLKQRARPLLWPGTALALAGVFLAMTQGTQVSWRSFWEHFSTNPAAYLLALVAAVSWALYSNLTRRWSEPGGEDAVLLFIPVTGLVLLGMRLFATEPTRWTLGTFGEAILLGAITALAYALWDVAMRKGNLLLVAACSYFTPLLSTLVSCAYLKVVPGPKLWLGCLLIVAGSWVTWRSVSGPPLSDATPEKAAPALPAEP